MHRRFCLIVIGSFFIGCAFGQSNFYYPNYFSAYYQNMAQINPAYTPEAGRAEFSAGYKSMTGAFRKISSYYFTASRTFRNDRDRAHTIRLQFYNEKEGSYISSPRVYANYAYSLPLSDAATLYSGFAIGVVGAYYSAPTTTQSSYTAPDGSLGLGLKTSWLDIGASMMQAFESTYAPVTSVVTYKRYYHAYAMAKKEWESEWGVKGQVLCRFLPSLTNEFYGTASLFYAQYFEAGASLKLDGGLSIFTLLGMGDEEDKIQLLLNYNSPFWGQVPSWQSNLEVGLMYRL